MLSKESKTLSFLKHNTKMHQNYNLNHLEFVIKRRQEIDKQRTFFSNNLLRTNVNTFKGCQDVVQLKLHNQYSPRKTPKLNSTNIRKLQKVNPYKKAIEEMKTYQNVILNQLQKSFNITKKPFSQNRNIASAKQSRVLLKRSKTALCLHQPKSQFIQNTKNYEQIILKNPQQINEQRMTKSAVNLSVKRIKIKNISVINQYMKVKSSSTGQIID